MSEVTGRLSAYRSGWQLFCDRGDELPRWWGFARRIDAIAFARRKGIRLEET